VEDGGRFYVTETQKTVGRVHEISQALLDGLFNQFDRRAVAKAGLVLDLHGAAPAETKMPPLPQFNRRDAKSEDQRGADLRAGFSLDFWLELASTEAAQPLLDSRDSSGSGILVSATDHGTIRITLNDGRQEAGWESDRGVLAPGRPQHVVITVDGGPKIITFVVNGVLCDGGDQRQFGWGRYSPTLRTPNGSALAKLGASVRWLRIYARAISTSEAVGNFRAGLPLPSR
jgi:hypothetical protein